MKRNLSLVLLMLAFTTSAVAQQGRGTILGSVTDQTGAVVPGAQVVITNVNTNLNFNAVSNAEGSFNIPALIVGTYNVTVTKEGFKKYLRSGIVLEVDQKAQLNVVFETGAVSEVIEVTGSGALVDTTTATLGKVIENRRVQELPLNGRNAFSLVLLSPAVQSGNGPTASGFGDRGTQVSLIRINGSPLASNNISVDGLSSTNPYIPDVSINPNVDSVQEFKVQSSAMSAEFGFTLGGVVNLVTKSGTNQYHGAANYWFTNQDMRPSTRGTGSSHCRHAPRRDGAACSHSGRADSRRRAVPRRDISSPPSTHRAHDDGRCRRSLRRTRRQPRRGSRAHLDHRLEPAAR